jgi:hypothetical protein
MRRCTLNPIGVHQIGSDSNSKVYEVHVREDGRHTCNCTGFVTKRNKFGGLSALGNPQINCKHLKRLLADGGCGWNSETGRVATYPTVCPDCQSPTEDYFAAPDVIDDEDLIAGLLATRDRMRS